MAMATAKRRMKATVWRLLWIWIVMVTRRRVRMSYKPLSHARRGSVSHFIFFRRPIDPEFFYLQKVHGRANRMETVQYHETKEYSDAYTQHESAGFTSSTHVQTEPQPKVLTASFSIQTDEPSMETFAIQTEPELQPPPKVTVDMDIQTEEVEGEESRSPS